MILTYVLAYCRATVSLAFFSALLGKLRDVSAFERTIASFGLVPTRLTRTVARSFLISECLAALFTLLGASFLWIGLLMSLSLLVIFSTALLVALRRHLHVSCNCFGPSDSAVSVYDLWRNVSLSICCLGGLGSLLVFHGERESHLDVASWLLVTILASVSLLLMTNLRHIAGLLRPS